MREFGFIRPLRRGAAFAAAAVLGVSVLAGCSGSGGAASAPEAAKASPKASPSPEPAWDTSPKSLAAVGDSITRAFDACSVLSDCPESSWATGTDPEVRSLAVRLLGKEAAAKRSWNFASSGARMADLPAQMEQAAAESPDLVTVLVGANDVCRASVDAMTPVAEFRADFAEALRTLRAERPKAQVYVASLPDLKRLWSQGRGSAMAKKVWSLGICPTMLGEPDAVDSRSTERRDSAYERVMAYNEALAEVCAKDELCRYDGGAVFDYRFGTGQLSRWDFFHPGKSGQARLAELAFTRVTAGSSNAGGAD
ncbi:SGNH/GDSL hydrolase family protein [Streptomyces sp. LHD-70]|uniref:SGNH/GDSL hydrolase family protein n=1 Tax=Streptomyces sp. LHD-70 TaxID=3072140 RepID=UPI00280E878A|nr:SGNH/GDSL hydrolase family protein [Streptomyces sp. LHD-70]MDQ8701214.1 SGNH/GDSL hydrolase family protein [Streptomyces sp. LHD-70]